MAGRPWWYGGETRLPTEVHAWLDAALVARGTTRTGPVEVTHARPWALVARVPTAEGPAWLKAVAPGGAHEIDVVEMLAREAPGGVLAPWAVDRARALLLTPDGGRLLGDLRDAPPTGRSGERSLGMTRVGAAGSRGVSSRGTGSENAAGSASLVPLTHTTPISLEVTDAGEPAWSLGFARGLGAMARLQQRTSHLVPQLLEAGVPDMRPVVLVQRFDEALDEAARRARGADSAWVRDVVTQVEDVRDFVVDEAAELGALAVPPAINHDDLHPWNFLQPARAGRAPVPIDWGDAVVSHPFCVLLVALRARRRVTDSEPGVRALRRAYLSAWQDHAPRFELARAADLACRLGSIIRAHTWLRVLRAADDAAESVGSAGSAGSWRAPGSARVRPQAGVYAAEIAPLLWLRNLTLPSYLGAATAQN